MKLSSLIISTILLNGIGISAHTYIAPRDATLAEERAVDIRSN
jgi:hypothetical protein